MALTHFAHEGRNRSNPDGPSVVNYFACRCALHVKIWLFVCLFYHKLIYWNMNALERVNADLTHILCMRVCMYLFIFLHVLCIYS